MTTEQQAALRELRDASQQYEWLLRRKQAIMAQINRALDTHMPAWQNLVAWEGKKLRLICPELKYIEQQYGDALLINQQAPLWI